MRKLVTIQTIAALNHIAGADRIEVATVLGWFLVVNKGAFKVGDRCIFFEVDSFLPIQPDFEFLRKSCYRKLADDSEGFRIKTIRLRGQISQGLALPITTLPLTLLPDGEDVTQALGVVKYEPPLPACLSGEAKGSFPGFLYKTDETRIQTVPGVLERHRGERFYYTEKLDGSSCTVFHRDGAFGVCSRTLELRETESNTFWKVARKYDLEAKLASKGNFAIQGEAIGEGIQKNKYRLLGQDLFIFNVFDIDKTRFLSKPEFVAFCEELGLKTVPIGQEFTLDHTVQELVAMTNARSSLADVRIEGYVFRPVTEGRDLELGRLSFKVLNPEFLLEFDE